MLCTWYISKNVIRYYYRYKIMDRLRRKRNFGEKSYKTFIEINFVFQPEFKTIFEDGFVVDNIIKNITLKMPEIQINEYYAFYGF